MIVLVHNIVPPYRIPLFNAISDACRGEFAVLLTRATHPKRRHWYVPWGDMRFRYELLPTRGVEMGDRAIDMTFGVSRSLGRLRPSSVVVAGWDVHACWSALAWARRREVPVYAWVESSAGTGSFRGDLTNRMRRYFLANCDGAIVSGRQAEEFVNVLQPGLRCIRMPNSVAVPELRALPEPDPTGGVLFMGALSRRKGFDLVLDAAPALMDLFDRVLVAGDGPLVQQILEMAAREPRVIYLGFVEGRPKTSAMASARVVLVPSRRDPWPLVACEALVARRPVVLGLGVASRVDLIALAGDAVVPMASETSDDLTAAALAASQADVPAALRDAFTPEESAAAFLSMAKL